MPPLTLTSPTEHEELDAKKVRLEKETWGGSIVSQHRPKPTTSYVIVVASTTANNSAVPHLGVLTLADEARIIKAPAEPSDFSLADTLSETFRSLRESFDALANQRSFGIDTPRFLPELTEPTEHPLLRLLEPEDTQWTDAKNHIRCRLVDKEIDGTITVEERALLARLQDEMLAYRRSVAPLPLDDLREIHQELLDKAKHQQTH